MEVIDAKWIEKRLSNKRGEKAKLARAMGVEPDVVTKILNGTRRVQPSEMPKIEKYFAEQGDTNPRDWIIQAYDDLPDPKKREFENFLRYLADQDTQETEQSE